MTISIFICFNKKTKKFLKESKKECGMVNGEEEYLDQFDEGETGIYSAEGREDLLEGDEISPEEEGFMEGYHNEETARCSFCHKPLLNPDEIIEKKIDDKVYRFCSEECLEEFEAEKEL